MLLNEFIEDIVKEWNRRSKGNSIDLSNESHVEALSSVIQDRNLGKEFSSELMKQVRKTIAEEKQ